VFGWQISTSAAPRIDASLSCHARNVSNSISRSSLRRSSNQRIHVRHGSELFAEGVIRGAHDADGGTLIENFVDLTWVDLFSPRMIGSIFGRRCTSGGSGSARRGCCAGQFRGVDDVLADTAGSVKGG
jgi:hypothetical protein